MGGTLATKAVMVTGGGSGIGRATSLVIAREGGRVLVVDRDREGGEETARLIEAAGGEAAFAQADVSDEREVEAAVAQAVARFGRLDGAFNNAALPERIGGIFAIDPAEFDRIFSVNVRGVWLCLRAEIRQMQAQGTGGSIVNTSSGAGLKGMGAMPAYSASKHAVIGLTKSVALEVARGGLRVNAVCPGVVDTPMLAATIEGRENRQRGFLSSQPNGRFADPREIGEAVVWLLSDAASFVTGVALPVDGGMVA